MSSNGERTRKRRVRRAIRRWVAQGDVQGRGVTGRYSEADDQMRMRKKRVNPERARRASGRDFIATEDRALITAALQRP